MAGTEAEVDAEVEVYLLRLPSMLRCFLEVNILLEAHLCDFHQGYGYGHGCGTGDGYSQRRVQFCSDSHSVECQVD